MSNRPHDDVAVNTRDPVSDAAIQADIAECSGFGRDYLSGNFTRQNETR